MRSTRRPAWPAIMLISGAIGAVISTGIWAGGTLASAAPPAASAHKPGHAQPGQAAPLGQAARERAVPARPDARMTFEFLNGVYCTSHSNCWTVGLQAHKNDAFLAQAEHWNGKAWRKVTMPSPSGTGTGSVTEPTAVRCASATECWTVGSYSRSKVASHNLMLRWNGRKWSAMSVPQPAGTANNAGNFLNDVTCISARNCWAVGYFGKLNSSNLDLVLHWNGTKWSRVRVPEPGGTGKQAENQLNNVRCPASSRCIAVGSYTTGSGKTFSQALIWNGRTWSSQHVPSPGSGTARNASILYSLGCGSKNSCWAVGTFGPSNTDKTLNQVMHWNGRSWSRQLTAQPAGTGAAAQNKLAWVTCTSDRSCWAVGSYGNRPSTARNQALHWNGKRWALVHTPNPGGTALRHEDILLSDRCANSSDCWAVGGVESPAGNASNEILHWNGKKWSVWPLS